MAQNERVKNLLLFLTLALFMVIIISFYFEDQFYTQFRLKLKPMSVLSYKDLQDLALRQKPAEAVLSRLNEQLNNAYVVNRSIVHNHINNVFNKPYIRLAHWNVERGKNLDAIKNIFADNTSYYYRYKKNIDPDQHDSFRKEVSDLAHSDIISLNEVDIGMPRTNYKNVVVELARTLNYNFAFATEFIELDPIVNMANVSPRRYSGLHGNAILSKYHIKNARVIRLPQCYDWFGTELQKMSPIEAVRRAGAKTVFRQEIVSEVRRGSRCALVVDIELPSKEILTVVSTHLEDRCYPDCRYKQTEYLLEKLKSIYNPLILAGDLNTSTTDAAPTSVKKEIAKRVRDRDFIARQIALAFIPLGIPIPGLSNLAAVALSKAFQYKDPAFPNIPVIFPNHERKLFKYIGDFQFADGERFDTRGTSYRSSNGKRGFLANSNERQLKGFESTFKFEEPRVIAYFKLDWFLVKPKSKRFEPFNGQTLKLVNSAYADKVSDHDPMFVDLTLARNQKVMIAKK